MLVMFTNWTRFRTGAPHCNSMEYHPQITLIQVSEIWIIYPDILIILWNILILQLPNQLLKGVAAPSTTRKSPHLPGIAGDDDGVDGAEAEGAIEISMRWSSFSHVNRGLGREP